MAHFREQDDDADFELRNALDDARVLIKRYQHRNDPVQRLDADQRRAWAEQMVVVLGHLGRLASGRLEKNHDDRVRRRQWLEMFSTGSRPAKPLPQDAPLLHQPNNTAGRKKIIATR